MVTTFQPGELKTVPNACSAVTAATLNQYLPGSRRVVTPRSLYGSAQSLCDWTLDAKPMYRVLEVTVRAYAPSGLASGNGSATFAAKDAYQQASLAKPDDGEEPCSCRQRSGAAGTTAGLTTARAAGLTTIGTGRTGGGCIASSGSVR